VKPAGLLRVAHLSPTYFSNESVVGGGERYVLNLAKSIRAASEHSATEVVSTIYSVGTPPREFEVDGISTRLLGNLARNQDLMRAIPEGLGREIQSFDLIHIHQGLTEFGSYVAAICASVGVPFVITDLGGGHTDLMLRGGGADIASGILSISQYAAGLVPRPPGVPHQAVVGPVDVDIFAPRDGVARRQDLVLCVSRILPHKGIDRVIRALPPGMSLRVVGTKYDDRYYADLMHLARSSSVEFVFDVDDDELVEHYREAGVFVQASTHLDMYGRAVSKPELMGLTTIEAMATGTAVITSDAGSLPELATDPRFSRVFSTHDELRTYLTEVLTGSWPDPSAPRLAREHVLANYALEEVGKRVIALYEQALVHAHFSLRGRQIPCVS
jgi:glycosyltransferase involved in cell wall biosynthesis